MVFMRETRVLGNCDEFVHVDPAAQTHIYHINS